MMFLRSYLFSCFCCMFHCYSICHTVTMFRKTLALVFVLYHIVDIGAWQFRDDYTFSKQADGWLKLHVIPATWSDAKNLCRDEGAILASPLTVTLKEAILNHLSQHEAPVDLIFTGVHSTYAKGVYTSFEGVHLSKLAIQWAPAEPNNVHNSESCLVMLSNNNRLNGTMGDVNCDSVYPFVCYKKKRAHESLEMKECGTHDSEYTIEHTIKKCYKFHRYGRTWPNAYRTCIAEGGHLAIVNSEQEFNVIKKLIAGIPESSLFSDHKNYIALGFSDPNDGGSWITVHGQSLRDAGFEGWASGEPNNASQPMGELCGVAAKGNGNFYDAPCWWSLAFVCEKEPEWNESS